MVSHFFVIHVSVHPLYICLSVFLFLDNKLNISQCLLSKVGMCIDIVEI